MAGASSRPSRVDWSSRGGTQVRERHRQRPRGDRAPGTHAPGHRAIAVFIGHPGARERGVNTLRPGRQCTICDTDHPDLSA